MKANTAVLVLLTSASFAVSNFSKQRPDGRSRLVSQALAAIVLLTASAVLFEYASGITLGIDTLLAADKGSPHPGMMFPQTASAFVLLGLICLFLRVTSRAAGLAVDFLVLALIALVMFLVAGYAFGVIDFFGIVLARRTPPQTVLILTLLCFVALCRRAEAGVYSVLAGTGIGSRIARVGVPVVLVMPLVLEALRRTLWKKNILGQNYAAALVAAFAEVMCFIVVLLLAWHIDSLSQEISDLSLRDDLTQLYNRRGFFLMAEAQLRLAQRTVIPFSVLFLDIDGLKRVNDTLGHEAGNQLLKDAAALIHKCVRQTDVAGRIGGDEFVLAAATSDAGIARTASRLLQAADVYNAEPGHRYAIRFSLGVASLQEDLPESLQDMVERADGEMYLAKRGKTQSRISLTS